VDTPVWVAAEGGKLYVMTTLATGKAKRIRNNPQVGVCVCDMRGGRRASGSRRGADRRVARGVAAGLARVGRKYGWQFRLSRLRGNHDNETILEISDPA